MLCGSLILLITSRPSFLNVRDLRTFSSGFLKFLEIKEPPVLIVQKNSDSKEPLVLSL
jgi:hypothetical protein